MTFETRISPCCACSAHSDAVKYASSNFYIGLRLNSGTLNFAEELLVKAGMLLATTTASERATIFGNKIELLTKNEDVS